MDNSSPMEIARLIRSRKLEIGDRRGERPKMKGDRKKTSQVIAEELGISSAKVEMYDRLNELIPELAALVDSRRIKPSVARHFTAMSQDQQALIVSQLLEDSTLNMTEEMAKNSVKKIREESPADLWAFFSSSQIDEYNDKFRQLQSEVEKYKRLAEAAGDLTELRMLADKRDRYLRLEKESDINKRFAEKCKNYLTQLERMGRIGSEWQAFEHDAQVESAREREARRLRVEAQMISRGIKEPGSSNYQPTDIYKR